MPTLESHHVVRDLGLVVTVFAQNVDKVGRVLVGHGRVLDLGVQVVPQLLHVDHRGLARGTGVVPGRQQVLEARSVQQVAAVRYVTRNAGSVNVLQADGTVGAGHILDALQETEKPVD